MGSEQSGIGLEGDAQKRFNEIAERMSQLSSDFSNHVLDATKAWHLDITEAADGAGLPLSFRRMAAAAWADAQEGEVNTRS